MDQETIEAAVARVSRFSVRHDAADLVQKVLKRRGKKSYGLIAAELGVTRGVVAGICFRVDHPYEQRMESETSRGSRNVIGTGYRTGVHAKKCLPRRIKAAR